MIMATTMLTSTPTKEKKKHSSPNKPARSSVPGTLKRNPNYELKKDELLQLLARFEAELQAKEVVIATLKSEKVKHLISNARFGRLSCQTDPYGALLRDSEYVKEDLLNEEIPMKNAYENQLMQLEELIVQQRKQVQTLQLALEQSEQRCLSLVQQLEHERKEKLRFQSLQKHLLRVQEEKLQLKNELNDVKLHNQELEQQLIQLMKLIEFEHERHKKFVVLLLNERKLENAQHREELKNLSKDGNHDHQQNETRFKELEMENERNKQILTTKIKELQTEIDHLLKEKKQVEPMTMEKNNEMSSAKDSENNGKVRSTIEENLESNSNETSALTSEKGISSTNSSIRRPTVIPSVSTKFGGSLNGKTSVLPQSSIPNRTATIATMTNSTASIPEIVSSPNSSVVKRPMIPSRPSSNLPQSPTLSSNLRSSPNQQQQQQQSNSNIPRNPTGGIPRLTKNPNSIVKPTNNSNSTTAPTKRPGQQTSFSSEHKFDHLRTLFDTIHTVAENRLKSSPDLSDSFSSDQKNIDLQVTSSSSQDLILFRAAEHGDTEKLEKLLQLGTNPNAQSTDGTTPLHLATAQGQIETIRILLHYGANPSIENQLGESSWHCLMKLNETKQLECLQIFVEITESLPPIDLIFDAINQNQMSTFGYLLSISHEELKKNPSDLSRLLRTTLRSSNTHFLQCLFALITVQEFLEYFDPNTFISTECLDVLSNLENTENSTEPIDLIVEISSSHREHHYSYAIGNLSVTKDSTWAEIERLTIQLFVDHITQIDSPFDYTKSSIGSSPSNINTITLGLTKWHYQQIPNENAPMPYTAAREQKQIIIQLKNLDVNSTDSLAYHYFIPSQNLKNFIRYIEQNPFVGVYGAPYLQKKILFEDLIRYFERASSFSTSAKFQLIRLNFELLTTVDDCVDLLVNQGFLRDQPYPMDCSSSTKYLLFFSNIQNSCGTELLTFLLNSASTLETCQELSYVREENLKSRRLFYSPLNYHLFLTMSKRTWSTENEIYKRFKWIPFKIDSVPWNGLLKRHLWRRMIDINIRENRSVDQDLIRTLQWISNVWQRYNECLQKLSLQDALLGPALFFDCPMEQSAIFEWFQNKWNTIIAPLVRELSMNKCAQPKSKHSAASAIASSFRANSLEISTPYESVACTALYVLLHRAVSRDCPLTGQEREEYLLNFVGSRLEGSGTSSSLSSAASSRASTPQPSNSCDFVSIQLE